jgi:hypothetical protein
VKSDRQNSSRGFSIVAIVDVFSARVPKIRHLFITPTVIFGQVGRSLHPVRGCQCAFLRPVRLGSEPSRSGEHL